MLKHLVVVFLFAVILVPAGVQAELPWQTDQHTRYMALGDSLTAGYGAVPATHGYVYLLYQTGTFDTVPNTLLSNAGVPGATSKHVLDHQVPQALEAFRPHVITITVGGNDLLSILQGADPAGVLLQFQSNLYQILEQLHEGLPESAIYISNLYSIPEIPISAEPVAALNDIVEQTAAYFGAEVADVYGGFTGRKGLLLIERHDAGLNVHPTNAGYRVMAEAFKEVIKQNK